MLGLLGTKPLLNNLLHPWFDIFLQNSKALPAECLTQVINPTLYPVLLGTRDLLKALSRDEQSRQREVIVLLAKCQGTNVPVRDAFAPAIADLAQEAQGLLVVGEGLLLVAQIIV